MGLWAELVQNGYIDEIGLVRDAPGQATGNALLYTAETAALLDGRGELTPEIKNQFLHGIWSCQIEPGYYRRHPNYFQTDQERQDDYIAIAALAKILKAPNLSREVLEYGRKNRKRILGTFPVRYYYPNERGWEAPFDPRAWLGLYPAMISCHKLVIGEPLGGLEQAWREACIAFGPKGPSDHDSFVLPWLMLKAGGDEKTWYGRHFYDQLRVDFQGGITALFRAYFTDKNHPLGSSV
jgi:hypothetical protein